MLTQKYNSNGMGAKRRIIAYLFLVCFVALTLPADLQALILTGHTYGYCQNDAGDVCAVCAKIKINSDLRPLLDDSAAYAASLAFGGFPGTSIVAKSVFPQISLSTPVTLKCRLNN